MFVYMDLLILLALQFSLISEQRHLPDQIRKQSKKPGTRIASYLVKPPVGGVLQSLTVLLEFHTMRKILSLAAALASAFTMVTAQAAVLVIDDFNGPDQFIGDTVINGSNYLTDGVTSIVGGGMAPGGRQIWHTLLLGNNPGQSQSNVTVGSMSNPTGSMSMGNGNGVMSQVDIKWTLSSAITNAISLTDPLSFFFSIVGSDTVSKTISYSLNGTSYTTLTTFAIAAPPTIPLSVSLTLAQVADIKATSDLWLRFTGDAGWDMAIDSIGFATPEPTSLALVGLALFGAGVVSRRRKA